jgi:hypothetical protein
VVEELENEVVYDQTPGSTVTESDDVLFATMMIPLEDRIFPSSTLDSVSASRPGQVIVDVATRRATP